MLLACALGCRLSELNDGDHLMGRFRDGRRVNFAANVHRRLRISLPEARLAGCRTVGEILQVVDQARPIRV
jgi:hypothetical protein